MSSSQIDWPISCPLPERARRCRGVEVSVIHDVFVSQAQACRSVAHCTKPGATSGDAAVSCDDDSRYRAQLPRRRAAPRQSQRAAPRLFV